MLERLDKQEFATASNEGLRSILRTEEGPRIVGKMLERLDKQEFATASNGGLWSILRTEEEPRIVSRMIEYAGDYFLQIAKHEFWSQMHRNPLKFEPCLTEAVNEFGMPAIAKIMPNCASRFCDDKYRDM
jgi:hypothetical protein